MSDFHPLTWVLLGFILALVLSFALINYYGVDEPAADETATVECALLENQSGAICFVSGDVQFQWVGSSVENGTVSLSELPVNNSTVRRSP